MKKDEKLYKVFKDYLIQNIEWYLGKYKGYVSFTTSEKITHFQKKYRTKSA